MSSASAWKPFFRQWRLLHGRGLRRRRRGGRFRLLADELLRGRAILDHAFFGIRVALAAFRRQLHGRGGHLRPGHERHREYERQQDMNSFHRRVSLHVFRPGQWPLVPHAGCGRARLHASEPCALRGCGEARRERFAQGRGLPVRRSLGGRRILDAGRRPEASAKPRRRREVCAKFTLRSAILLCAAILQERREILPPTPAVFHACAARLTPPIGIFPPSQVQRRIMPRRGPGHGTCVCHILDGVLPFLRHGAPPPSGN